MDLTKGFWQIPIHPNDKKDFNFSTERPRVLNFVNVVSDDDNIKQDKSIDVYDRYDEDGQKKEQDG